MSDEPSRRRILVTDGEQRAALAVVRSLGAAGNVVYVAAPTSHSLAAASRFARSEYVVADALANPDGYAADIHAFVTENDVDAVIPMTEAALLALLPVRDRFPDVLIPFADAATFMAISDKQAVLDAAARVGIAIPAQAVVADAGAARVFDTSVIQYPVVIKPVRSVSTGSGDRLKLSVQHAGSQAELRTILDATDARAYPLLLQQRIVGAGVGIFALIWNGEPIAQFAHRRIREKPPSGGISVYRTAIALDPELRRLSLALLSEFAWQGVAMVEYKIDERNGTPYLMEINGRFWGSLQLAIDAGVDFPRLLLEAASGSKPTPVTRYRTDVRSRWFWGDVDHLLARLRKSNQQLSLTDDAPSRWQAVKDFFAGHPDDVSEIRRRSDWKPFLRESLQWFQQLGR